MALPNLPTSSGPLSDLLVVELGQLIAGPFCGQLLGDMGAEVIKVEPPGEGDPMRKWGQGATPTWWEVIGRNKRSVTINLRDVQGQALVRELISRTDILVENFKPGTLEKWGLGPDVLTVSNPRLIIVRMSGYGQTGPYASRAGFGGIGEAMGGLRRIVGEPDRPPARVGISIGDSLAATYGCLGALAALHHREITGRGQVVDSALYESVLQVMESLVSDFSVSGHARARHGATLPGIAPSNVYPCSDGELLIGANGDSLFQRLCEAMNRPELAQDVRYATHEARGERQVELDYLISDWTRTKTVDELESLMEKYSIPAGRIFGPEDMLNDPHFIARESIVDVAHPELPTLKMQNVVPRLSETPGGIRRRAPAVPGQDNHWVLQELLGLDEKRMSELREAGVI